MEIALRYAQEIAHARSTQVTRAVSKYSGCCAVLAIFLFTSQSRASQSESFRREAMPSGVRVAATELDGSVFTDPKGRTLYKWPLHQLRNGVTGDHLGVSECTDVPNKVTSGLMSPYPPGLSLPEADAHPSCTQVWPPFLADARA